MLNLYLKLLKKTHSSAGWTLVELMIASSLTLMVTMISGFGLMTIGREDKVASVTGEMRNDMNRAASFITEEIRSASVIETSLDASDLSTFAGDFNPSGKTPVLALKVPDVPQRIIYYMEDVADADIWRGPAVIRRWGPDFTSTGAYGGSQFTPGSWNGDALIDMVVSDLPAADKDCRNLTTTATEGTYTDASGQLWYRLPAADADVQGFFVCVREDKQLTQLNIHGTTLYTDASGNQKGQLRSVASTTNTKSRYNSKAAYEIITQAFTRSDKVGSTGEGFPDFYVEAVNKQIKMEEAGKAKISVLYLNTSCDDGTVLSATNVNTELVQELPDGTTTTVGSGINGTGSNAPATVASGDSLKLIVEATNSGGCLGTATTVTAESDQFSSGQSHAIHGSNDSQYLQLDTIIEGDTEAETDAAINDVKSTLISQGLLQGDSYNTLYLADNQILYFVELEFDQPDPSDPSSSIPQTDATHNDAIILVELSD